MCAFQFSGSEIAPSFLFVISENAKESNRKCMCACVCVRVYVCTYFEDCVFGGVLGVAMGAVGPQIKFSYFLLVLFLNSTSLEAGY